MRVATVNIWPKEAPPSIEPLALPPLEPLTGRQSCWNARQSAWMNQEPSTLLRQEKWPEGRKVQDIGVEGNNKYSV